jgi:cytochrome c-type biogenesis protein CcmE
MNVHHRRRLTFIVLIVCAIATATSLALYALQQNINLFYSPSQVATGEAPRDHEFRLGGLVKKNSVRHAAKNLQVSFIVTDNKQQVIVRYNGVLPDLFREGQSVVVDGKLNSHGEFIADQVLAKHDEKYMPKEISAMLKKKTAS